MLQVNKTLLELFSGLGVEAEPQGEWIAFAGRRMRANAWIVSETERPGSLSVQLDVRLEIDPGCTIIESFGGFGETREKAIADAFRSFAANSLHVLLAVFLGCDSAHVSREVWPVGGRESRVTIGGVGVKGRPPVQDERLLAWFGDLRERIQEKQLLSGTHWVRLYYAQWQGKAVACEVLLDNGLWEDVQSEMAAVAWPVGEEFYSVRVFLVLQVGHKGSIPGRGHRSYA